MHSTVSDSRAPGHTVDGIISGVGAGALWGLVFLVPELVGEMSPIQITAGRYLCFGVLSVVMIAPRWKRVTAVLTRQDWVTLFWLALTANTLYFIFVAAAVQMGGVAMTALVVGFIPVLVTLSGSRAVGAVPLSRLTPSLLLCTAGVVCIGWEAIGGGDGDLATRLIGFGCAVGGLVSWTIFAIWNSRCLNRLTQVSVHDWNLLTGVVTGGQALLLIPVTLLVDNWALPAPVLIKFAAVAAGTALLASIVGNSLWNRMSRLLPLTLVGQMILFETLFALIYGCLWERRMPSLMEYAAFILVVCGVISCLSAHRPEKAGNAA